MMTAVAGVVLTLVAYGIIDLVMNAVVNPTVTPDIPDPTTGGAPVDSGEGG